MFILLDLLVDEHDSKTTPSIALDETPRRAVLL